MIKSKLVSVSYYVKFGSSESLEALRTFPHLVE